MSDIIGNINDEGVTLSPPSAQQASSPDSGDIIGHVNDEGVQTEEDRYGSIGQKLGTAAESAASTLTFGLSRAAEPIIGKAFNTDQLDVEHQQARERENPLSSIAGGIGGFATGLGAAGAISAAGAAGAEALGLGSRAASQAVKFGIEGALMQGGNETAKLLTNAPQTAGSAAINIGLSGLIGGALGGATSGVSSLWSARYGSKVASALDSAGEAVSAPEVPQVPTGVSALKPNADVIANSLHNLGIEPTPGVLSGDKFVQTMEGNLAERGSVAGVALNRERGAIVKKLQSAAEATLEDATDKSQATVGAEIKKNIGSTLLENLKPIEEGYKAAEPVLKSVPIDDNLKLEAIDPIANHDFVRLDKASQNVAKEVSSQIESIENVADLKKVRTLISSQLNAKYGSGLGSSPEAQILQTAKNSLTAMRTKALQGAAKSGIISPADAEHIGLLDSQYSAFQDTVKQLGVEGGLGKANNARALLSKFNNLSDESFTKKIFDTGDVRQMQFFKQNFPEAFDKARQYKLSEILEKSINHSQGENGTFSTAKFLTQVRKLGPEAQDSVFNPENLQKIRDVQNIHEALPGTPNTSHTSYAEAFSKILSPVGLVQNLTDTLQYAWLKAVPHLNEAAELAGGDSAAKLAAVKFAQNADKGTSPEGFKAMTDYIRATMKGESELSNSVGRLFDASKVVVPPHLIPDQSSRDKLQKTLDTVAQGDNALGIGHQVGHYLPDHATAQATMASSAINYLNAIKPTQPKNSPLDTQPPVDKMAQVRYNRALDIAQQPLMVIKHTKDGTLMRSDVDAIRAIYPETHDAIIKKVSNGLIDHKSKDLRLPYAQRQSMNLLVGGNPLDSTMSQQAAHAIMASSQMQQQQKQAPPGGKPPTGHASASTLNQINKVNDQFSTRLQAREARRHG